MLQVPSYVGATVRKPVTSATPAVEALLEHLASEGFQAAPRTLGRDELGRQVLDYIPGVLADTVPPLSEEDLEHLGQLVRRLHDTLQTFVPPANAAWNVAIPPDREELICHNDLAPWNLVRDGDRWVFIDWDGAGPGSGCGTSGTWLRGSYRFGLAAIPKCVAAGCDDWPMHTGSTSGSDVSFRASSPRTHVACSICCKPRPRPVTNPWARLHQEGHGAVWRAAADFTEAHAKEWAHALADDSMVPTSTGGPSGGTGETELKFTCGSAIRIRSGLHGCRWRASTHRPGRKP